MRLSNLADYAVVMLAAAVRGEGGRLNASLLADRTGVPLPTAQKLVGRLAAAGLIVSTRGSNGGFRLARSADLISLADIVEAVEGPIAMTACVEQGKHDCAVEHSCQVRPHWNAVNDAMRGALAGVSLAQLASSPPPFAPSSDRAQSRARIEGSADCLDTGSRQARSLLDTNGQLGEAV